MPFLSLLVTLLLITLLAIFTAQNPLAVTLRFAALQSVELPLGLAITLAAGFGALSAFLASLFFPRPRSFSVIARQLQHRLDQLGQPQ